VRLTKLNTSDKVSLAAAILVVAVVLIVLLILFTGEDKWSPL
jgi:hypothetical protein